MCKATSSQRRFRVFSRTSNELRDKIFTLDELSYFPSNSRRVAYKKTSLKKTEGGSYRSRDTKCEDYGHPFCTGSP